MNAPLLESKNFHETFIVLEWIATMELEYQALVHNETWVPNEANVKNHCLYMNFQNKY